MFKLFIFVLFGALTNSTLAYSTSETNNIVTFTYTNKASLTLTETKFIKNKHEITLCGEAVCLIDGTPFWGSDAKTPKTQLTSVMLDTGKYTSKLDTTGMYDPLINKNKKQQFTVSHYYGDTWKVKGVFSDGSGTYFAEWLVTQNGSIRTLLGDSELLYDSFDSMFNKNN